MTIAERLKSSRAALGLKQEDIAALTGIPIDTLRKYEGGTRLPGAEALEKLAKVGVDLNWLVTGVRYTSDETGKLFYSYPPPSTNRKPIPVAPQPKVRERAGTPAPAALDVAALQTVTELLEEELARKHARLDPARKAEVVAMLYEEAVSESEEEPRRGRVLHLLRLVA